MGDKDIVQEILERITRIETKIDGYNNLREKLDTTYTMASKHDDAITEIKGNQRWLWRTFVGALISAFVAASILIK